LDFEEFLAAVMRPAKDDGLNLRAMLGRQRKADVRGNSIGRLFLLVFLLYSPDPGPFTAAYCSLREPNGAI
jgi:hypothetical protein